MIDAMGNEVLPIEETDPAIGDLIYDITNKKYEYGIKEIYPKGEGLMFVPSQITHSKTGRNDPCPCGSGKKYKKCCQKG